MSFREERTNETFPFFAFFQGSDDGAFKQLPPPAKKSAQCLRYPGAWNWRSGKNGFRCGLSGHSPFIEIELRFFAAPPFSYKVGRWGETSGADRNTTVHPMINSTPKVCTYWVRR